MFLIFTECETYLNNKWGVVSVQELNGILIMTIRYEDYSSEDDKASIQTLKFSNKNVYAKSLESVKWSVLLDYQTPVILFISH